MLGLILFAVALSDPVVLHAEMPAPDPRFHAVHARSVVEVRVAPDGSVVEVHTLVRNPFVQTILERASCDWQFAPQTDGAERVYQLTYELPEDGETEQASHFEMTRDDALTVRVQYFQSTLLRLTRPAKPPRCPVHRQAMQIGVVPLGYGLPSFSFDPRAEEVRDVKVHFFPEANMSAEGGCIVGSERKAEVYYCAKCRQKREAFFRRNPWLREFE
ncbi:MAG: hypothetical protein JOZ54_13005 [Acidobacteria bacterium]|nr:hypothetical protein [Acidobacteriota bacterium]